MAITSFATEWKTIKTNFEKATNKKKPSEKFLGVFNKSSGIEKAARAFDGALASHNPKDIAKTQAELKKAGESYKGTLAKAVAAEKDKTVQAETRVMLGELVHLLDQTDDAADDAVPQIKECSNIGAFAKLMKNKDKSARVLDYAKRTYNMEVLGFLEAMVKKDHSPKVFKEFIKDNDINIAASLLKRFDEDNLDEAPWGDATKEALKMFNDNLVRPINSGK